MSLQFYQRYNRTTMNITNPKLRTKQFLQWIQLGSWHFEYFFSNVKDRFENINLVIFEVISNNAFKLDTKQLIPIHFKI